MKNAIRKIDLLLEGLSIKTDIDTSKFNETDPLNSLKVSDGAYYAALEKQYQDEAKPYRKEYKDYELREMLRNARDEHASPTIVGTAGGILGGVGGAALGAGIGGLAQLAGVDDTSLEGGALAGSVAGAPALGLKAFRTTKQDNHAIENFIKNPDLAKQIYNQNVEKLMKDLNLSKKDAQNMLDYKINNEYDDRNI